MINLVSSPVVRLLLSPACRRAWLGLALAGALLGPAPTRAQDSSVRISEFMAINSTTLKDEDDAYSDWIEIFNGGTNTVNLGGWYLASSAANLTKWQFPATNLGPNQFLIVFASDKNRRVPGAPLHANFKLGGSGEYLALVMPDGLTKTSEFAPAYPPQYADIPYGYVMTGAVSTLISPTGNVRALVPAGNSSSAWRNTVFNDSAWLTGLQGVGFDASGSYTPAIGLDLQAPMLNANASAYIRLPFNGADPAAYNSLALRLRYDDGFVAYLNGTMVASRNAPASPAWNSAATAVHGAPQPGTLAESFEGAAA
ncbi:MAG TPA: lamin tail domain-containing protein, partial [Clostridia bacterium]|nr:lamin tail domain-containing protein [Clostridia bacterium]